MKIIIALGLLGSTLVHASGYTYLSGLSHNLHVPEHILTYCMVICGILALGFVYKAKVATLGKEELIVPDDGITIRNVFEFTGGSIMDLVKNIVGDEDAKRYFPLAISIFLLILLNNMLGLIPGFMPATTNMNTTLALGLFSFLYYNYQGIKKVGIVAHIKHLMGPVLWLAPLIFIIEVISHVIRPLTLALRLRFNMEGDHMVLAAFTDLTYVVIPVIFLFLGTFIAFIQAFVFTILSLVYVKLAIESHDHDDH